MHLTTLFVLPAAVEAVNFAYESIQLTEANIAEFPAIAFGDPTKIPKNERPVCRVSPDTPEWPVDDEWSRLNSSVGGALLKPIPTASACYDGPNKNSSICSYLLTTAKETRFYINDPLTALTEWTQGGTCPLALRPKGNCTQGGSPVYVVNVTTVSQIQAAVNFARNRNVRLVIK